MCTVRTMEVKRTLMVNDHAGTIHERNLTNCYVCSKDCGSKEDFNDHAGTVHERNLTNFNWIFVNSAEVGNIVDIYLKAHLPK